MIIQTIKESDFLNIDFTNDLLTETVKKIIPMDVKKYMQVESNRTSLLQEYGEIAFLENESMKYPVINHKTGDYDCRLIYCARLRSRQSGEKEIMEQADALSEKLDCTTHVNITLEGHADTYDLVELLEIFKIDFTQVKKEEKGI